MGFIEKFGPLMGRVLLALMFVPSGFSKVTNFDGTVGYIAAKGLPLPPVAPRPTLPPALPVPTKSSIAQRAARRYSAPPSSA